MADTIERIEWNDAGFIAIMQGPEVRAELNRRAGLIRDAAGIGQYVIHEDFTRTRVRISVGTADFAARYAEATERTLTRAFDAGRG